VKNIKEIIRAIGDIQERVLMLEKQLEKRPVGRPKNPNDRIRDNPKNTG
jgi:hypothetical protein